MDKLIIIIAASVLAGMSIALLIFAVLQFITKLEVEKKFKEKKKDFAEIDKKSAAWNFLFMSGKIGELIKKLKYNKLEILAEDTRIQLDILGGPYGKIDSHTFIGSQVIFALLFVIVAVLVLDIYNIIFLALAAALGFYIPYMWIKDKVSAKHRAIFRQVPDILDMLTLMVEAGLDFNASLNRILDIEKGQLVDEFIKAQQEIKLGKSRVEAFESMSQRLHYEPLTQVLNSMILAIKTGGSLSPTLRALSEQFRVERSQLAEKLASQAPIKLMFPLVAFIFPTVFFILFGPILLSFMGKGF